MTPIKFVIDRYALRLRDHAMRLTWRRQGVALESTTAATAGVTAVVLTGSAAAATSASHFTALPPSGTSELQTARDAALTAPLLDGRVLIAGGLDALDADLHSLALFNPLPTRSLCSPPRAAPICRPPHRGGGALRDG
jgi:hypothetical protein